MAKKDLGVIQADKEFLKLEKRLNKIYKEAEIDVQHKMNVYFAKYQKKNDTWLAKLKAAENTDDYPQLQKDYQKWLKGQVFQGKQWEYKKESIASALTNINQVAVNMINDAIPDVFQFNGNYAAYQLEQGAGVDFGFNMYDSSAVKQIIAENKDILPFKKLDKAKDVKWNFRSIKNEVAKGIIEGESINKIANRLSTVIPDRNKSMLRTHARTMVTSAQNAGRLERFKDAQSKGLEMEKEWFCTLDGRTRDTHRLLDRQRKPLDEPFEVDNFKIMYPADPHAHPSMVYNCRCTMNSYLKKYPPQYTTRSARDDNGDSVLIKDMSYQEWEEWKNGGKKVTKPTKTVAQKVTKTADAQKQMKTSLSEAYEHHRIANGLNAVPAKDLGDDYFEVILTKMDDKVRDSIANQFSDLASRYDTPIQKIVPMGKMDYLVHKDSFATTFHSYEVDSATIMYNPVKINDVNRIKELIKNGFATQINEELADKYVITHEFAHTLIDMGSKLDNKRNWLGADYKRIKGIRAEINDVYDRYVKEIGELDKAAKAVELEAITTMDNATFENARKLRKKVNDKAVSRYALTNSDEFMAECFAHAELGGAQNDYVDEIMEIINKNFRR